MEQTLESAVKDRIDTQRKLKQSEEMTKNK